MPTASSTEPADAIAGRQLKEPGWRWSIFNSEADREPGQPAFAYAISSHPRTWTSIWLGVRSSRWCIHTFVEG